MITKLTAVVLVYHDEQYLDGCIQSLRESASHAKVSIKIILVINDITLKKRGFKFPKNCKLIFNKSNLGVARSINLALDYITTEWIIFVSVDTITNVKTLARLIKYINNKRIAIVAPKILNPNQSLQYFLNNEFNLFNIITAQLALSRFFPWLFKGYQLNKYNYDFTHFVPCVFGTYFLINKNILQSIGGYDEQFHLYMEDIDLCKRIIEKDFKILYVHDTAIIHYYHQSNKGVINTQYYSKSLLKYINKWFPELVGNTIKSVFRCGFNLRYNYWLTVLWLNLVLNANKKEIEIRTKLNFYKDMISRF